MDIPSRNRETVRLGPVELELHHFGGVKRMDPNEQVVSLMSSPESYADMRPLKGLKSVLSGKPAFLYRTDDIAMALTMMEYVALVGRELEPDQVRRLRDHFGGDPFELHGDFYGSEGFEALQPKGVIERFLDAADAGEAAPKGP